MFHNLHGACSEYLSMHGTANVERLLIKIDFVTCEHAPDRQ